jgi:hypothetical protein
MAYHYIGTTKAGAIVSRKSTNPDFTHAAARPDYDASKGHRLPSFSTSAAGAIRNFESSCGKGRSVEVVEVREVSAKEYRAATAKPAA